MMPVYRGANPDVVARVPSTARRILDLGCGTGEIARRIKMDIACQIVGVTHSAEEASVARGFLDAVVERDLNLFDPEELGPFDTVICSHILEHLQNPEQLLARLHKCLRPEGTLIVTLPNILYWTHRLAFLRGEFRYTSEGPLDRTHLRFYDWTTARQLIEGVGYDILSQEASGHFPLPLFRKYFPHPALKMDHTAVQKWPGLFGVQFLFTGRRKPTA